MSMSYLKILYGPFFCMKEAKLRVTNFLTSLSSISDNFKSEFSFGAGWEKGRSCI